MNFKQTILLNSERIINYIYDMMLLCESNMSMNKV